MALKIETLVNGPFQENCYLVWDAEQNAGIFIDPGDEPDRLMRTAQFQNIQIEGIYNTHGHIDHAGGVAKIQQTLNIPFAIHPDDEFLLAGLPDQAKMFGLPPLEVPRVDRRLVDGDEIIVGQHSAEVIHTPGHTPGGICFLFDDVIFVGDTLFAGSVGRSDLPGGSHAQLIDSIKTRLMVIDDDVRVFSGHGPVTTIGSEKRHNPFITGEI